MVPLMMMRICSFNTAKKLFSSIILFLISSLAFSQEKNWVFTAQKFSYTGKANSVISDGFCTMFPQQLMEKLVSGSAAPYRTIGDEELLERQFYNLKKERTSLFLQLSNELQKRDSILLNNYSEKQLEEKINAQKSAIEEVQKKINENLNKQKEIEQAFASNDAVQIEKFLEETKRNQLEKITSTGETLFEKSTDSLEKELMGKGISGLITGNVKAFGEYLQISVEVTYFPGNKKIATVTEFGTVSEAELLVSSISRQLLPSVINALPSNLKFKINPEEAKAQIYIDGVLNKELRDYFIVDSGVHTIEISADGYAKTSVSYLFEGNTNYIVEVNLREEENGNLTINFVNPVNGNLFYNGESISVSEESPAQIVINGKTVLAQFISENNESAFVYIPAELLSSDSQVQLAIKNFSSADYIEKRRRWMYTSYSVLITSLIPAYYLKGKVNTYTNAAGLGIISSEKDIDTANKWLTASNISTGISIGCGVWFVYELIRYLYAANNILPVEAE